MYMCVCSTNIFSTKSWPLLYLLIPSLVNFCRFFFFSSCAYTHQLILPWSLWFTILMRKTCKEKERWRNKKTWFDSSCCCCCCWVMWNLTFSSWTRKTKPAQFPLRLYHLHSRPTNRQTATHTQTTSNSPSHIHIHLRSHTSFFSSFFLSSCFATHLFLLPFFQLTWCNLIYFVTYISFLCFFEFSFPHSIWMLFFGTFSIFFFHVCARATAIRKL